MCLGAKAGKMVIVHIETSSVLTWAERSPRKEEAISSKTTYNSDFKMANALMN